jgi:hypothetical protein
MEMIITSPGQTAPAPAAEPVVDSTPHTPAAPPAPPAGDPPPAEPQPGDAPAEPAKKPEPDSARFAALKRRERAAVAAEGRAKEASAKAQRYEEAVKSGDVDKMIEAFGLSGDQLVDLYIKKYGGTPAADAATADEPDSPLKKEVDELKKWRAERESREQGETAQAAVRQHMDALRATAAKSADRYELVNAEGAHDVAFDVMVEYHRQHGKFLTHDEALDAVENQLEQDARARLERFAKTKKLSGLTRAPAPPAGTAPDNRQTRDPDAATARMRDAFLSRTRPTVTNAAASAAPTTPTKPRNREEADVLFRQRVAALHRPS